MTAVIFTGVPIVPTVLPKITLEALDLIVSVIDRRFKQESFSSYAQMETILVKAANSDDYESDVDTGTPPGQLSALFIAMLKISCFDNPGRQHPGDKHPGDKHPRDQHPGDQHPGDERPGDEHPGDEHPGDQHPGDQHPGDEGSGTKEEGVDTLCF